jgi:hypothetical protein
MRNIRDIFPELPTGTLFNLEVREQELLGKIRELNDREIKLLRDLEALVLERDNLRKERDLWFARAAAMFWNFLPEHLTLGELQKSSSDFENLFKSAAHLPPRI